MVAMESAPKTAAQTRAQAKAEVAAENWKLLQYFNYYRLTLAVLASLVAIALGSMPPLGQDRPELFLSTSLTYAVLAILGFFTIRLRMPDFDTHATLLSFADITLLTMVMYASGGVGSGIGLLLAVAIAGASLMLSLRLTTFYASIAALAAILQHAWPLLTGADVKENDLMQGFSQVGLFGIGLYATALLGYTLANRLRATEKLAEHRGVAVANLTQVNDLIIERMQSGVLVCDSAGQIRQFNQAAQRYLGIQAGTAGTTVSLAMSDIAPDLGIQLAQWFSNGPEKGRKMFRSRSGYLLLPRFVTVGNIFSAVGAGGSQLNGALVFLDDMAILKQQAQQLKMEALARLTGSIAHEIRNPLGAISNAAQLLGETVTQNNEEQRLIKIIDEQSRRMNVIVQNVTQLARRDKTNPVRLALAPWLTEFVRQYAETTFVPKEMFSRVGGNGLTVCVDPEQLYQVVSNLCQNALRHSPAFNGSVQIKLQAGSDEDGRPYLDVIDWGSGVLPEIVDSIFDPFFTTTPKGTGLGLYIARELCEGNGGSLDYYPGEGGVGSRFRVTFARAEECAEFGGV
jgi:two-component system sensor histidine kinase PilS (NtrC family)